MRRPRGNIILTALLISVFLFFLSVALIWTNRQDIALSLSMEHKLKAQAAARSIAYKTYARLRKFGEIDQYRGETLPNGVQADLELLRLPAQAQSGDKLLVRVRATSGPISSYFTLHLAETQIAGPENVAHRRALFFPKASGDGGSILYGDFELEKDGGEGVVQGMVANQGPVFATAEVELHRPVFRDYIPIFPQPGLSSLKAYGPTAVVSPKNQNKGTVLRRLSLNGQSFDWEEIPPPSDLGDPDPEIAEENLKVYVIERSGEDGQLWNNASLQGIDSSIRNIMWLESWTDEEQVSRMTASQLEEVAPTLDWENISQFQTQEQFVTQGAVAARGESVYTYAWHFLYRNYQGGVPTATDFRSGSRLFVAPCVLKYKPDVGWEKVWVPMDSSGEYRSEDAPNLSILLAREDGTCFSLTVPAEGETRRLLTLLPNGTSKRGEEVPPGQLVLYRDEPYLIPEAPQSYALINLLNSKKIGFQSLPSRLPEISGEILGVDDEDIIETNPQQEASKLTGLAQHILGNSVEGSDISTPDFPPVLNSEAKTKITARLPYEFRYRLLPRRVGVDGKDLWALLEIETEALASLHPSTALGGLKDGKRVVLARYDSLRWHILPHGFRTGVHKDLSIPEAAEVVAARYDDLPKPFNRYAVISVDTRPFEFRLGRL